MYKKIALAIIVTFILSSSPIIPTQNALSMPSAGAQANAPTTTGVVIDTMNASGYTYMLVDSNSKQNWVAIPAATVKKGAQISYFEGMTMSNFTSKTLDRTFESIIFSPGLTDVNKQSEQPQAPADDSFAAALHAENEAPSSTLPMTESVGSSGAITPLQEVSIEKSTAENGYTIGEIFEKAKELDGKKVSVNGKVVKFSPNIMGRHWVHMQDGTGDPMQNSHDLVFTTAEEITVDSIVTFEGVLAADKDFGAGYKYVVIIEEASVTK